MEIEGEVVLRPYREDRPVDMVIRNDRGAARLLHVIEYELFEGGWRLEDQAIGKCRITFERLDG